MIPIRQRLTPRVIVAFAAAGAVLALTAPAAGQATVQRVDVSVAIDGLTPHRLVQERLVATVQSVADRLLLGRLVDQLTPLDPRLGEAIGSVVDRVAIGYAVAAVTVQAGTVSTVAVRLRPVGIVIQEVTAGFDLRAFHPKVHPLLAVRLNATIPGEARALLSGLPAGALEWAWPVVEPHLRSAVETALPGFTAAVQLRPGQTAHLDLVILARGSRVVRNIGVRFRSTSIPTMILDQHAPQVISMAEPLRGLPVAFAEAHRGDLERLLADELAAYPPALQYRVVATPALDVGETTYVTVQADSLQYRARVEAHINVGTQAPPASVQAHLGRVVAPRTEVFFETHFVPNTLSWQVDLGTLYELSPTSVVGLHYTFGADTVTVWSAARLGRDVGVRWAWNLTRQTFEGAVTYRVNEVLSGELITTSRGEVWIRLVSNL